MSLLISNELPQKVELNLLASLPPISAPSSQPKLDINVYSKSNEKVLKTFLSLCKQWEAIAQERLAQTRSLRAQNLASQADVEQDKSAIDSYKVPLKMFKEDLNTLIKAQEAQKKTKALAQPSSEASNEVFIISLNDQNNQTQALASIVIKANEVYLNTLFTAPWNYAMKGANQEEHKALITKGAGSTLLAGVYTIAQKQNKPVLSLKPTKSSKPYYEKMGMNFIERDNQEFLFIYTVDDKKLPNALVKPALSISSLNKA